MSPYFVFYGREPPLPSVADLAVEEETERYNRKAKHTPYEEGDIVYMKVPKKERTKLQPK
jgi:hypothetical protein